MNDEHQLDFLKMSLGVVAVPETFMAQIEAETRRLRDQYGDEFFQRHRVRLRDELAFFYGVDLEPADTDGTTVVHTGVRRLSAQF